MYVTYGGMRKKTFILLSGIMIGSTLFAVPRKPKVGNAGNISENVIDIQLLLWFLARPMGGTGAEYYSRMESELLRCASIKGRYGRLMNYEEHVVDFPLERKVSKTFLSMLKYYLPDDCTNAKAWRNRIAICMLRFQSGRMNIAKIKAKMYRFCVKANSGEIVFDHYANGFLVLNLVLYELERLMGIAQ